jgi:hypothetical protein
MTTQTAPVILAAMPESIDGLLSIFQDLYVKLGTVALDIDGYETFRDASYLGTAKDTIEELALVARLAQCGLLARRYSEEASR